MRQIGIKYHTEGDVYKYDGTMVPRNEPLFLFRGRDRLLPQVLEFYLKLRQGTKEPVQNLALLQADLFIVQSWQQEHADQVRTPR